MMHDTFPHTHDAAVEFEPLTIAIDRVAAGIARTAADQRRPGSDYLRNPPLTTREREWAARARLAARLLEVLANADGDDVLSPSLDPALVALRAIVADADRAPSPRC
ncbi:hypothetical protein Mpop_2702 [Methylorubrum populi BJ001]|jgi:hypothetical protein|uniref:Uncharacterized protein n=1 Tax=Methylorubrum populi (strain ATCC BAA-705 / NCIMB 13946 / BJ001) TaxID=441620 RepID=B1ZCY8_METPB|nr:hypothetical protein [Methylorubrum populi]ACB80857.1 hypothetical protein Mpop_2702 [Methylorubrum populi BJ001]